MELIRINTEILFTEYYVSNLVVFSYAYSWYAYEIWYFDLNM